MIQLLSGTYLVDLPVENEDYFFERAPALGTVEFFEHPTAPELFQRLKVYLKEPKQVSEEFIAHTGSWERTGDYSQIAEVGDGETKSIWGWVAAGLAAACGVAAIAMSGKRKASAGGR